MKAGLSGTALVLVAALSLAGCGGGERPGPVEVATLVTQVESFSPPPSRALILRSRLPLARGSRPDPVRVHLARLDAPEPAASVPVPGRPIQIGSARVLSATTDVQRTRGLLQFMPGAAGDGLTAAVSFSSPGAAGIRLGLLVEALPPGARVRGYANDGDTLFELSGAEILDAIERNRSGGDLGVHGRTFWTPAVDSDEVTLQIALPAAASPESVKVSVPLLSHMTVTTRALETLLVSTSGSCEIDVSCSPEVDDQSRATARMIFVAAGFSFACTGTLLNDVRSSGTPYFLSANHCISSQTAASSLTTYWFYRSSSCNSQALSPEMQRLNGGATLLYASMETDTSFMRLNNPPPPTATFAGWSSAPPQSGQDLVGIHHPHADLQKISRGVFDGFMYCGLPSPDVFNCRFATQATGNYLSARWSQGTVESGSSGSGLFAAIGSGRFLVGQLKGGSASCLQPSGLNAYGRFDLAYNAALNRWLSPDGSNGTTLAGTVAVARVPVHRFYNHATAAHFYTANPADRDYVLATFPTFAYEGVAFYAYDRQIGGASPVFRLYNRLNRRHFYSMSAIEKDAVLARFPEFTDEGIGWYAQPLPGGTANPMYRFYNATVVSHFYTLSELAKAALLRDSPAYALEGIAYYAWPTQ